MNDLQRIGRYETIRLLGRGGMGTVYLARDPLIDRLVAIKVLAAGFDQAARNRFTGEARAAGRLHHENIATIFDVGEHQDAPFIAMEYVPGETLAALIHRPARSDLTETLRLIEEACAGLAFAHRAGIVHLDVKPENLMRRDDGRLKVLDFGIARVLEGDQTHTRHLQGTLRYMSPEQLRGGDVDARADVFALGCVLYEVVSLRPAFTGEISEIVSRIEGRPATPLAELVPGVRPELIRMTERAMAHDPADRYDDLDALRQELAALRLEIEGAAAQPTVTTAAPPSARGEAETPPRTSGAVAAAFTDRTGWWATGQWRRPLLWGTLALATAAGAASVVWRAGATPTPAVPIEPATNTAAPGATSVGAGTAATSTGASTAARSAEEIAAAREALRFADRAATLTLLRERPYVAVALIDELTSVARLAAEEAKRAADARGPGASGSPDYRAATAEFERARTLEAAGDRIGSLSALWQASDLFVRAATPASSRRRAGITPPERSVPDPSVAAPPLAGESAVQPPALPPGPPTATGTLPAVSTPPPSTPERVADPVSSSARAPEPPERAPVPAEARNPVAPEDAVRAVLFTYAAAYELRDINAVRRVFPEMPAEQATALARTFGNAASYRLKLRVLEVQIAGTSAVATCEMAHELVPRVGSPSSNVLQSRVSLRLMDGAWLIQRVDSTARR